MKDHLPVINIYKKLFSYTGIRRRYCFDNIYLLLMMTVFILVSCTKKNASVSLLSPDGKIATTVYADSMGRLIYHVRNNGKTVIDEAALGIRVDRQNFGEGVLIGEPAFSTADEKYAWQGVHDTARNNYHKVVIPLTHQQSGTHYQLEIKAFNDGMAFRYVVPKKGISNVEGEASSWKIPSGSTVWYQENIFYYEGLYHETPLSQLGSKKLGPPLTYQTPDSIYVSITEAALYNYSGMSLQSDSNGMLHAAFVNDSTGWKIRDTIVTPWRVAMISNDLNGLVNTDIIQNLNLAPDSNLQHANWIKPGRAVWSYFMHGNVTTMALEKTYIDKAAELGFEYNMVDAGWETSWPNCMDSLKALVQYAKDKKVGIWVWKSYASLKDGAIRGNFFRDMYSAGVAGMKIDFIDKEGIEEVTFYEAALKDASVHHLMVNFHGANKPSGYNRTYPNELTREAIYGQEWTTYNPQGPLHNTILPFTRFLAGPADATPGVFDSKKAYGTSRAHQLALQIIFNSALTCWPADPTVYLNSTALPLIKSVSTVWDKTIVLPPSNIGKIAAFARRKGSDWYIGIINAGDEKRFMLPLKFLGLGNFKAAIFQDDLTNPDQLLYSHTVHTSADSLLVVLRPEGGFAATLKKSIGTETSLTITPNGGYLYAPIQVNMETNSGLQIRYTRDGKDPTAQSPLFTNPFTIVNPALIRATAFSNGKPIGATGTAQFLYAPAPLLSYPAGLFINNKTIRITTEKQNEAVHYTLDGSEPTPSSQLYKDSLLLIKTVVLKAKTFFKSGIGTITATARYTRQEPATAESDLKKVPGLTANFFEDRWQQMPDFNKLTGGKISVVSMPDLKLVHTIKEYYAIEFSGYIKIPITGVYSFYALSDDGSLLFIDDEQVVDNNGSHGDLEKSGDKALAAGLHKFRLRYFQNGSGQTLQVYMKGPGMEKQIITPALFFH